jgi:hypothetical protein
MSCASHSVDARAASNDAANWRLPDVALAAYANGIQKFFNWRATPRAVFKKKDRDFLPTRARPPRGSLAFIIVMYVKPFHHCIYVILCLGTATSSPKNAREC